MRVKVTYDTCLSLFWFLIETTTIAHLSKAEPKSVCYQLRFCIKSLVISILSLDPTGNPMIYCDASVKRPDQLN